MTAAALSLGVARGIPASTAKPDRAAGIAAVLNFAVYVPEALLREGLRNKQIAFELPHQGGVHGGAGAFRQDFGGERVE